MTDFCDDKRCPKAKCLYTRYVGSPVGLTLYIDCIGRRTTWCNPKDKYCPVCGGEVELMDDE